MRAAIVDAIMTNIYGIAAVAAVLIAIIAFAILGPPESNDDSDPPF
jgi:hypothetical protein